MKAIFETKELQKAVLQVMGCASPRSSIPACNTIRFVIGKTKATLTCTDLEKAVQVEIPVKADEEFDVLTPRISFSQFLIQPEGEVSLSLSKDLKKLTAERTGVGKKSFYAVPVKDFPPIPTFKPEMEWATLDAKYFCRMVSIVAISAATEESRPILTGICFADGALAAADGFRLNVLKDDKLSFGLGNIFTPNGDSLNPTKVKVTIPAKTTNLTSRLFGKEESMEVGFDTLGGRVFFRSGKVLLTSQLIQGQFPAYEQLIPQSFVSKISFSSPVMVQRLNMVARDLNNNSGILRLVTTEENKESLRIYGGVGMDECVDEASFDLTMPATTESGETKIAFNYKYVLQAAKPFALCHLETSTPSSPGKITGDIEGLCVILMPMFVTWP